MQVLADTNALKISVMNGHCGVISGLVSCTQISPTQRKSRMKRLAKRCTPARRRLRRTSCPWTLGDKRTGWIRKKGSTDQHSLINILLMRFEWCLGTVRNQWRKLLRMAKNIRKTISMFTSADTRTMMEKLRRCPTIQGVSKLLHLRGQECLSMKTTTTTGTTTV